jgi:hypothetical protein
VPLADATSANIERKDDLHSVSRNCMTSAVKQPPAGKSPAWLMESRSYRKHPSQLSGSTTDGEIVSEIPTTALAYRGWKPFTTHQKWWHDSLPSHAYQISTIRKGGVLLIQMYKFVFGKPQQWPGDN